MAFCSFIEHSKNMNAIQIGHILSDGHFFRDWFHFRLIFHRSRSLGKFQSQNLFDLNMNLTCFNVPWRSKSPIVTGNFQLLSNLIVERYCSVVISSYKYFWCTEWLSILGAPFLKSFFLGSKYSGVPYIECHTVYTCGQIPTIKLNFKQS